MIINIPNLMRNIMALIRKMKNMILQLQRMNMPFANAMCIIMLKITMATTLEDLRLHEADICARGGF